jgi:imidazolonepropionase-like amidohydrolase
VKPDRRALLLSVLTCGLARLAGAQTSDSLRIYYVARPVGWEKYTVDSHDGGQLLTADFSYIDRGRRIHRQGTMATRTDYTPTKLEVFNVADTARTLLLRVELEGASTAAVTQRGQTDKVSIAQPSFALSPYTPMAQHLMLIRYWRAHGKPKSLTMLPGDGRVTIARAGTDTVAVGGQPTPLTRYTIDGIVWGREYAWLDAQDRLAMFTSAAGGLSTKGIRADLLSAETPLMDIAARAAVSDLAIASRGIVKTAHGTQAILGRVIDATGRAPIENGVVIVRDDRIVAVGPAASTPVPAGATRIDTHGGTIIPGLWDMHAHLHQAEWLPVYLAAGVTTVRDMGNELPFIVPLRKAAMQTHTVVGPRIVAAGLVDGPGPNAFGALSAGTPEEGRAIVRRYHDLGFEQMKLYSVLSAPVVGAITDEAHKLGMTVTGHIPNSLTVNSAVDSGMDQIAHLPLRGAVGSDSLTMTIAHLRAKNIVVDPTSSWGEIGGHSTAEPLENFQPVTAHLPATFLQTRAAGWGVDVDTATAHARLARSLALVNAVYRAGVPIVAGTDEGVPGFSVWRELELYVRAGMTPMDALRSATAVPAKAMRLDQDTGTLEPDKRADLVVLDANPLENISNVRRVRQVMTNGVLYQPAALWPIGGFIP